jgi:hypothetical protein
MDYLTQDVRFSTLIVITKCCGGTARRIGNLLDYSGTITLLTEKLTGFSKDFIS